LNRQPFSPPLEQAQITLPLEEAQITQKTTEEWPAANVKSNAESDLPSIRFAQHQQIKKTLIFHSTQVKSLIRITSLYFP